MPDYKKGMIYKIVNNENNKVYYGSTTQGLHKRIYDHRQKHNKCMSKNLGVDLKDCQIILVEKFPCECKYELEKRERYFIENNECVNKVIPTRTQKEWCKNNKAKIAENHKKWSKKNKDKLQEYNKQYREKNKEKAQKYKKQWREINKEQIAKKKNENYKKNKEKINKKQKEKITCECGSVITKSGKAQHCKTKKHIKFINSNSTSSC